MDEIKLGSIVRKDGLTGEVKATRKVEGKLYEVLVQWTVGMEWCPMEGLELVPVPVPVEEVAQVE